jgi:nucleotide-binding universal stress UspA family protein
MFNRLLVGVDGHQGGRDAIALAANLSAEDGTMSLVHVFGAGLMPGRGAELLLSVELDESQRLLELARDTAAPTARLIPCADRTIGHALHVLAERHDADLIVVGACRHSFLGRLLLGNDAVSAMNGAPCAVAIAPLGYAERARPCSTIGVGYDGSPESEQALATARALAPRLSATIRALSVVSLQCVPYGEPIAGNWPDPTEALIDLADVEQDVTYGDPSEELVSFSDDVDLLIVGSRGYGPIGRLMHGSTSNQLARRARCPVLVLPRDIPREPHPDYDLPFELAISPEAGRTQ